MTSSLYFLPPTSSPPWLLISSKISSVAPLWGMPQGAAGPERGVVTPNLMTSAAPPFPGATPTSSAATKSVTHVRGNQCLIAIPSLSGRDYTIGLSFAKNGSDSHGDSACSCDRHQARRVVGGCPRQAVASLRPSVPPSSERLAAWAERECEGRSCGGGACEWRGANRAGLGFAAPRPVRGCEAPTFANRMPPPE